MAGRHGEAAMSNTNLGILGATSAAKREGLCRLVGYDTFPKPRHHPALSRAIWAILKWRRLTGEFRTPRFFRDGGGI